MIRENLDYMNLLHYSFTIEQNKDGRYIVTLYDEFGDEYYKDLISEELANASEDKQVEYIEQQYSYLINSIIERKKENA